jgi:hypothetical protein
MTRRKQNRRLKIIVAMLAFLVALAFYSKLTGDSSFLSKLYDPIKDTSLLIATAAAAYLANIYQKRQQFLQSLREQWREIVQAKTALICYCQKEAPTQEDYLRAFQQLSECIDNMRIVYSNVGETEELIGLFPYEPLHDMRRILEEVDPRNGNPTPDDLRKAHDEIWGAFNAIREHFLDEFEIEQPARPILARAMRRRKQKGATEAAQRLCDMQMTITAASQGAANSAGGILKTKTS